MCLKTNGSPFLIFILFKPLFFHVSPHPFSPLPEKIFSGESFKCFWYLNGSFKTLSWSVIALAYEKFYFSGCSLSAFQKLARDFFFLHPLPPSPFDFRPRKLIRRFHLKFEHKKLGELILSRPPANPQKTLFASVYLIPFLPSPVPVRFPLFPGSQLFRGTGEKENDFVIFWISISWEAIIT